MSTRIVSSLFLIILIAVFAVFVSGQAKTCDVRLNVFLINETEKPQAIQIDDVVATAVNLFDNNLTRAKNIGGKAYFTALSNGEYNIVISKSGYQTSAEIIRLNCRMTNEKNIFDEVIFTAKNDFNQVWKFPPNNYVINISPPPPPSPSIINNSSETKSLYSISAENLNDRIIYLPKVKLSDEMQKYSESIRKSGRPAIAAVFLIIDENGNVVSAKSDERTVKDLPDLIEKVSKAKFLPFIVDGQKVMFSGELLYQY